MEHDISSIEKNYKYNKNKIKNLKKNTFLSSIVKLQEDLINNYYNEDCMENDFITSDKNKEGYISVNIFKVILQKRLYGVDEEIYNLFIKFEEDDDEQEISNINNSDKENSDNNDNNNMNKNINYKRFLNKLATYKIKDIKNEQNKNYLPIIK